MGFFFLAYLNSSETTINANYTLLCETIGDLMSIKSCYKLIFLYKWVFVEYVHVFFSLVMHIIQKNYTELGFDTASHTKPRENLKLHHLIKYADN